MSVYGKHVSRLDGNKAESKEAAKAINVFMKNNATLLSKKTVDSWTVSPGMVFSPKFPRYVMDFSRIVYKNATLFEGCRHIRLLQRSGKPRAFLHHRREGLSGA